ncbi:hypothetical protein DYE48_05600 [Halobacillus trueperi]|uniref:Uncharacterized protein n=2 Tax=Halobacillus trueperi TaxID=156205 RepID=A0A3E0JC24_9BACI|nr:hypothetical protein DYE48_05600 [Halobacillus trueperi]
MPCHSCHHLLMYPLYYLSQK